MAVAVASPERRGARVTVTLKGSYFAPSDSVFGCLLSG
jgi:hypothetical protein